MIYKTHGKTGIKLSAVGFGGMRFDTRQSDDVNAQLLRYAYDKGINYFDTAPGYCQDKSETIFGLAVKAMPAQRESFFISTKGMPTEFDTAAKAVKAVEKSLKKLQTDWIDFYHIWCLREPSQYELAMRSGGQYEGLLRCKEKGLIRHIVASSHMQGQKIRVILEEGKVEGILLGINILNFPYRWTAVEAAHQMGYGVVAMNPLAGGIIPQHADKLAFLAGPDETPTEAALRFCISCPQITVTLNGFTTREHIDMACAVADTSQPFTDEDLERLRKRIGTNMDQLCTGCGYCLKECPKKIPVAAYMQYYNEKLMGVRTEAELIKGMKGQMEWGFLADRPAQAADCIKCKRCEEACTQHLNIIERLAELARWQEETTQRKWYQLRR